MFSYIFFMIFKKLVIVFGSINFILKNDFKKIKFKISIFTYIFIELISF